MSNRLPLSGLRVIEFSHMVMGPSCGLILADLGADIIKIEPLQGDKTRILGSAGAGFFTVFNRNKNSLALDLAHEEARDILWKLLGTADVLTENFRPGFLDELGFSDAVIAQRCPRLVIAHLKGFLSGPYQERTALDELVQLMSGLAYMTGSADKPARIGSSVIDITAGMFGVIGILAALRQRDIQGVPAPVVKTALFETAVLMVAQHMAQYSITGEEPMPMQERRPAWGVYDLFPTRDGQRLFIAAVSDRQWQLLCDALEEDELARQNDLATNAQRQAARSWLIERLALATKRFDLDELVALLEPRGLPYAPVAKPHELLKDPHLQSGGLLTVTEARVGAMHVPCLPLEINGQRMPLRQSPPLVGENTQSILVALGLDATTIIDLRQRSIVAG